MERRTFIQGAGIAGILAAGTAPAIVHAQQQIRPARALVHEVDPREPRETPGTPGRERVASRDSNSAMPVMRNSIGSANFASCPTSAN